MDEQAAPSPVLTETAEQAALYRLLIAVAAAFDAQTKAHGHQAVMKGGTALKLTLGLTRPSTDIDFDATFPDRMTLSVVRGAVNRLDERWRQNADQRPEQGSETTMPGASPNTELISGEWRKVEPTNRFDAYITGYDALNLDDPATGFPADWHQSSWRPAPRPGHPLRPATPPQALEIMPWVPMWREHQLFDCRKALKVLGHPAAAAPEPVWCARHVRAIIEIALSHLEFRQIAQSVTPHDVSRYLETFPQIVALHWWIRKFGRTMRGEERAVWYDWQQRLHPGQHYDTTYPLPWPVFWSREEGR